MLTETDVAVVILRQSKKTHRKVEIEEFNIRN